MGKLTILAASIGVLASPLAAQPSGGVRLSEACRGEVRALCGSATDRDARRACMKENRSKLSEGCGAEIKARKEARMSKHAAPKPE